MKVEAGRCHLVVDGQVKVEAKDQGFGISFPSAVGEASVFLAEGVYGGIQPCRGGSLVVEIYDPRGEKAGAFSRVLELSIAAPHTVWLTAEGPARLSFAIKLKPGVVVKLVEVLEGGVQ